MRDDRATRQWSPGFRFRYIRATETQVLPLSLWRARTWEGSNIPTGITPVSWRNEANGSRPIHWRNEANGTQPMHWRNEANGTQPMH